MKYSDTLLKICRLLFARFGPQHWWPAETQLEVIVGVVLTQNTAWTNVEKAIRNLKKAKALTWQKLYAMPEKKLAGLIVPAGYYNIKARRLKNVVRFFYREHKGNLKKLFHRYNPRIPLPQHIIRIMLRVMSHEHALNCENCPVRC